MGPQAFDQQHRPWQVRAAQIGYRAKVVRRPQTALSGFEVWTSVLSLDSKARNLSTVLDWTPCHACSGKALDCATSEAHMFLFVFAFCPSRAREAVPAFPHMNMTARVPDGPRDVKTVFMLTDGRKLEFDHPGVRYYQLPPKGSGLSVSKLKKRITYCAQHGELPEEYTFGQRAVRAQAGQVRKTPHQALVANSHAVRHPTDPTDQEISATELCVDNDSDEFLSCSESDDHQGEFGLLPRQVRSPSSPGDNTSPGLCSLRRASSGKIREQEFHHLSLQFLQRLQTMQRKDPPVQHAERPHHVLHPPGLRAHFPSSSGDVRGQRPRAGRWGSRSHRGQGRQDPLSAQHSQGQSVCDGPNEVAECPDKASGSASILRQTSKPTIKVVIDSSVPAPGVQISQGPMHQAAAVPGYPAAAWPTPSVHAQASNVRAEVPPAPSTPPTTTVPSISERMAPLAREPDTTTLTPEVAAEIA